MINYNILNEFVEKLKSAGVTVDDISEATNKHLYVFQIRDGHRECWDCKFLTSVDCSAISFNTEDDISDFTDAQLTTLYQMLNEWTLVGIVPSGATPESYVTLPYANIRKTGNNFTVLVDYFENADLVEDISEVDFTSDGTKVTSWDNTEGYLYIEFVGQLF